MSGGRFAPISLGGSGSSGAIIVNTVADLPISGGQNGQIYYVLSEKKLYAWNTISGLYDLIGGSGTQMGRNGSEALLNAQQTVVIAFSSVMPSASYRIVANFLNIVDADPIYLIVVSTQKTVNGFSAEFNAPTDSANYIFDWAVMEDAPQAVPGTV